MVKVMEMVSHPTDPAAVPGKVTSGGVDLLLADSRSP